MPALACLPCSVSGWGSQWEGRPHCHRADGFQKFSVVGSQPGMFSWLLWSRTSLLIVFSDSPFHTPRALLYESWGEMHFWGNSIFYQLPVSHLISSGDTVPYSRTISKQVVLNLWWPQDSLKLWWKLCTLRNTHIFRQVCTYIQNTCIQSQIYFRGTHTPRLRIFLWVNEHRISYDQIVQ